MGTRALCMSRGACSTSSSTYPRGVSRSCRMHWSGASYRSTRSKHTMVPGRAASIARQLSLSTALAARISSASSARMTRGGGTIARAFRSSRSWRSRSLNSSVGLSMTRTLGNRLQMARLSSVERWSATTMWSAKRLVTDRNRSRIHASLRTGVTTTMRTGSDTVVRYDGTRVCDTRTAFAYSCREPRRVPRRRRRGVAPSQRHSRLPRRAGGAISDARRGLGAQRSSYDEFQENVRRAGVVDAVDCRRAFSYEVARDWTRPLRLLWIDGDHVYESVKQDLALFRRHLAPGAIVAMHDVLGTWPGPLRVFVEDVLESDDFGPAGCFKSIGWAQYRPADGRAWRFHWRRRRLAAAARRLIPVAQAGWATSGLGWWRHKLWWRLLPHGPVDPARWAAQVAIE